MIIEALLEIVGILFDTFLSPINIPKLPEDVHTFLNDAFTYLSTGAGILANYTPLSYLMILFSLIISIDASLLMYHFVLWLVKKIPALSIS